jgi:outer membrane protein assembly factor BamE (lipoprotein component of BamABCDE complex)
MSAWRAGLVLLMLVADLAGCAVPGGHAPGLGHVTPQAVQSLQVAGSSRAEILMTLGAPDHRLHDDRVFCYLWSEALVTLIVPAGYQVGTFTVWGQRMLMFAFADDGSVVRTATVEAATVRGVEEAARAWAAQGQDAGR